MRKGIIVILVLFSVVIGAPRTQAMGIAVYSARDTAEEVARLVNSYRTSQGLQPLIEVSLLDSAAIKKAQNLVSVGEFKHRSGSVRGVEHFANQIGYRLYDYRLLGENLACGVGRAEQTLEAWIRSETHRKNLLEPKFSEYGIGFAWGNVNYHECQNLDDLILVMAFGGVI